MTRQLRLWGLSLAPAISAVLGGGMLLSACGTVAGAGKTYRRLATRSAAGRRRRSTPLGCPNPESSV
jgi:predicted small secreted protein